MSDSEVSLAIAAYQLGISWSQAWRLTLQRALDGRQDTRGRWFVSVESVERVKALLREVTPLEASQVG